MLSLGATDYYTGLKNACFAGHEEVVKYLLDTVNLNRVPRDILEQSLINACLNNKREISKLLINKGANVDKCFEQLNYEHAYFLQTLLEEMNQK